MTMTRTELNENIEKILSTEIMPLFASKNESYGDSRDGFWNFKIAATLIEQDDSYPAQFRTLMDYVLKHIVA